MSKRGFTLIELLLVTGIISILMSVIFFRVTEAKKKAEDAHMVAESAQVTRAVYQYREDNGGKVPGYTSGQSGRKTVLEKVSGETTINPEYIQSLEPLVTSGYLPSIPYSPNGNDYAYIISENGEEAVFSVNLNYPRSGNNRNSCDFIKQEGNPPPQFQCTYVEPVVTCTSGGTEWVTCHNELLCEVPLPTVCTSTGGNHICKLVPSNNICSGVSDTDYCSCI